MSAKKLYTYNGKTMYLKDWAIYAGLSTQALRQRLWYGWDFGRAISTPNMRENYEFNGTKYSIGELVEMHGDISRPAMYHRIRKLKIPIGEAIKIPNRRNPFNKVMNNPCGIDCENCPYSDCIK